MIEREIEKFHIERTDFRDLHMFNTTDSYINYVLLRTYLRFEITQYCLCSRIPDTDSMLTLILESSRSFWTGSNFSNVLVLKVSEISLLINFHNSNFSNSLFSF